MIKAAIFDVDGTLLDSMQMWHNFASDFVRANGGIPEKGLDDKVRYFTLRETNEYFSSRYNLGTPDDLEELSSKYTDDFYSNLVVSKPYAYELCKSLYDNGVKMYIATATYSHLVKAGLKRNNLLGYFEGIITCGEVGLGKENPDIFIKASQLLHSKISETWVFEDALHAIKSAKFAGFKVLGIYDETENDHITEIESICDIYTYSFKDINFDIINNLE